MRIISKQKLREYTFHNAQAALPLIEWYYKMKQAKVNNLTELRKIFNSVDAVNGYTIFNIAGNRYRLITAIHYNNRCCYIRAIWTHAEYDKKLSRDKLRQDQ